MSEIVIQLEDVDPVELYGVNNAHLNKLKATFPKLKVVSRGNQIKINGEEGEIALFREKLNAMMEATRKFGQLPADFFNRLLNLDTEDPAGLPSPTEDVLVHGRNGMLIRSRTMNQRRMVSLSDKNDILFAIGPAGTGKTYTAVALAVRALKNRWVKKIILTRPAVEAGENLGFLPGDLKEKIDPYLRPLYDALDDMVPIDKLAFYMQNRVIEVAPLAFMRGRTLDHSFIILDEAQNTSHSQLKMFLTRIGPNAKCIVTGDLSQIDLPKNQESGLSHALDILKDIDGIGMIHLGEEDVIRHRLVKHIIRAYQNNQPVKQKNNL